MFLDFKTAYSTPPLVGILDPTEGDVAEEHGPANHSARVRRVGADEGVGEAVQRRPIHWRHEDVPSPRPRVAPRRGGGRGDRSGGGRARRPCAGGESRV
jgi:hypothetical protein